VAVRNAVLGGVEVIELRFDFRFLGGSIGRSAARLVVSALERAAAAEIPLVSYARSGGCRMQEGFAALGQLTAISAACARLRSAGVPHVSVVENPTTGGVWASLCSSADVILAVDGADIAFGGHRVREATLDRAFTAAGKYESGQVDQLLDEAAIETTLATLLQLFADRAADPEPAPLPRPLGSPERAKDGWDAVLRARAPGRPTAREYLRDYFDLRVPLSGDRAGGRDPAMLCGLGRRGRQVIAYVTQAGGPNSPAGFRTAARVIRLAGRLGFPILTLIDTPGAANDRRAELDAIGPAIGDCFASVSECETPITTLVIGEGGSGGALAIASPQPWMTPDSYFAVIAPESAAAIMKCPETEVPGIARSMKVAPAELLELGLITGISRRSTPDSP